MQKKNSRLLALILTFIALVISGCGGSGGSTSSPTVSGTAATGLPIAGEVSLKDSSPSPQERKAATGSNGSYVINVAGLTSPFIIRVDWTDGTGPHSLLSFADAPGTANITPISDVIVANAAGVTSTSSLYATCTALKNSQIAAKIPGATSQLISKLKPLLDAYGVNYNPISGPFAANHVGLDAMLDAVRIEIAGGSIMVNNRGTGDVIFSAPVNNFPAGIFDASKMPTAQPGQTPAPIDGAALYDAKCAGCHDPLATSTKASASVARIQTAITANIGGMGSLASLSSQQIQAIVAALASTPAPAPSPSPAPTPTPTPVDGAALYDANCAGCHGALAGSNKKGITLVRLQTAINNNIAGMGSLSTLSNAEMQAIVDALASTPAPAPSPSPTPTPTPTPVDGAALYAANCAGCHGVLASSTKAGISLTRLQTAINGNVGGMGMLTSLSSAELQAIVDVLAAVAPAPVPTPTPTPTPVDGTALYGTYCASCHGSLATSAKAGATVSRIQGAINSNAGGMGFLSTLTAEEVQAIATVLATVTPSPTPAPTPTCGSCHAIPPSSGHHSTHRNRSCATCHGSGYSSTSFNAATHNNGVVNMVTTIGWNASNRTCANSCHGTERW